MIKNNFDMYKEDNIDDDIDYSEELVPQECDCDDTLYFSPKPEVCEDEESLYVAMPMFGMKKEDVDITVIDGMLYAEARSRKSESDESDNEDAFDFRRRNNFKSWCALCCDIDASKAEAKLEDGILYITMPKAESAKPKKIPVS